MDAPKVQALDTRTMRVADCGTDHVILRSRLRLCRRKRHCRTGAKPPRKLNTSALKGRKKQEELTQEMDVFGCSSCSDTGNHLSFLKIPLVIKHQGVLTKEISQKKA